MRYPVFILLTFIIAYSSLTNELIAQNKAVRIDSLLKLSNGQGVFNGNALVYEKQKLIYSGSYGYADAEQDKKLTLGHRFNIGSISKELSAVSIMLLIEEGKLTLDDSLSHFFDNLPKWSNKVKVRHLLQYTGGFPKKVDLTNLYNTPDETAWRNLRNMDVLVYEPGEGYSYSNYHIFLRQRIIEKVTGLRYSDFLRNKILNPCGMEGTLIDPNEGEKNVAIAFDENGIEDDYPDYLSGALYMNANDLYKWAKCLHGDTLLRPASLETLYTHVEGKQGPLGVIVKEDSELKFQWDSGSSYSYQSSLYVNPIDSTVIILTTNVKNDNVGDLTTEIDALLRGNR